MWAAPHGYREVRHKERRPCAMSVCMFFRGNIAHGPFCALHATAEN